MPSGGDTCHLFAEGYTPSSLLHCTHLEEGGSAEGEGSVDWFVRMVLIKGLLISLCC